MTPMSRQPNPRQARADASASPGQPCITAGSFLPGTTETTPVCADDLPVLLLVADVATRLRISERELRRWIAAGRLPVVRFGRAVRIRPADLAQLIASGLL